MELSVPVIAGLVIAPAYQHLQVLPRLAPGPGSTFWVMPSDVTSALQDVSRAFTEALPKSSATCETSSDDAAQAKKAAADALDDAAEAGAHPASSPSRR